MAGEELLRGRTTAINAGRRLQDENQKGKRSIGSPEVRVRARRGRRRTGPAGFRR
jgi:hypothetical protein